MLNVWSLSVRRRGNDPPDHFLTLLRLEFTCSFNDDPVLAHQPPDTPPLAVCMQTAAGQRVPHIDADLLQLFGHPGAAIATPAQARLLLDVRQNHHVHALPAAGRPAAKGP